MLMFQAHITAASQTKYKGFYVTADEAVYLLRNETIPSATA